MRTISFLTLLALCTALCGCEKKEASPPTPKAVTAFTEAAFEGNTVWVAEALENEMLVDQRNKENRTALMLAAFNGHTETLQVLLNAGADVTLRDSSGRTPLMFASTGPFPSAVRLLLKNGSEVNAVDSLEHFSALMFAAGEGLSPIVELLLEAGADPTLKDVDGDTAANFARLRSFTALADQLDSINPTLKETP